MDEGLPREVTAYLQEHWQGLFPNTNDVALEFLPGNFSTNPRPHGPAGPAAGTGPGVATPPAGNSTASWRSARPATGGPTTNSGTLAACRRGWAWTRTTVPKPWNLPLPKKEPLGGLCFPGGLKPFGTFYRIFRLVRAPIPEKCPFDIQPRGFVPAVGGGPRDVPIQQNSGSDDSHW